ncbi:SGNH/GDSL hydrolase family protein [Leptospira sp. GIMC2001]|uniref:SGNH/GDSL hydrolase family protein n=1 Tax=Leptospira sp. GIMC2001 TaxID=1513297 RepID=UPI00234B1CC9|nr:GDSL-type esterase/lipase family protein [Leptospira sp. GIMC2001]WCL50376.1 GDSL-type esterase/lipase family protein [Leptospira sp. GIMC2001]
MRNKKFTNTVILLSLFLFSAQCKTLFSSFKYETNYFSSDFECNPNPGLSNESIFKDYLGSIWLPIRFIYQADNEKIKKAKTVIVGNSLVQLFTPDLMEKEFPSKGIVNRGIGGDMTETLLLRIEDDVLVLQPQNIIIEIGGNDMIFGKCHSFSQKNVHSIIAKIRSKLPGTKIIFLAVPPTDIPNLNAIVPIFNIFLASLPKQYSNLHYLETWTEMKDTDLPTIRRDLLREGLKDKLHFNEKGYSIWGKLLRPLL